MSLWTDKLSPSQAKTHAACGFIKETPMTTHRDTETRPLGKARAAAPNDAQFNPHDQIAFELGWDFARHGVALPTPYGQEASPLRSGWLAGQAAFGERVLQGGPHAQRWLRLRLHAWLRGRHVELYQVTPHYLRQLEVTHCPITRAEIAATGSNAASVDRVRNDAAYAAGNLAVLSQRANHAKGALDYHEALGIVRRIEAHNLGGVDGLNAVQWRRVASLCSLVEPLGHEQACLVPMRVLPPNRLRLFNPVQALQAFVSQQLLTPGWSHRVSRFEDLLPGRALRRDFKRFFMALLPRVIEAGRPGDALGARWAVEDAWGHAGVVERWAHFARQLTPAQCEKLLERACARGLGTRRLEHQAPEQATEGWELPTRGYTPMLASPCGDRPPQARQLSLLD